VLPHSREESPPASLETRRHEAYSSLVYSLPSPEKTLREFGAGRETRLAPRRLPRSHCPAPNSHNTWLSRTREAALTFFSASSLRDSVPPAKRVVNPVGQSLSPRGASCTTYGVNLSQPASSTRPSQKRVVRPQRKFQLCHILLLTPQGR
jgi:hypothetical protein